MSTCARCLSRWNELPLERRLEMTNVEKRNYNRSAVTTVDGVPVCAEDLDAELARVEERRTGAKP